MQFFVVLSWAGVLVSAAVDGSMMNFC